MKKKNVKVVSDVPSRVSMRIKTNAEIKQEPPDDEAKPVGKKVNVKKTVLKPKGKAVQAATSVKEKAKKIVSSKRRRESQHSSRVNPKMTVLALAAARKRKLNGEDDEDEAPRKRATKKTQKKKVTKKKGPAAKPLPIGYGHTYRIDEAPADEEVFDDDHYDEQQTMIAIKQEQREEADETNYEEEFEDNEDNNLLIHEEHQYMDHMGRNNIADDQSEIEVPQEQVQAELQDDMNEDEDDEQDDDEDIDENLFFGIPEQRSPDLATCTHCKGKFRKEDVHEHMLTCPERYVQCRECGKILSNLQTLERHHKRFHLKIREVPCTLCDKMFIDEAAARKHLKTVHFKVKNFHCPHCDKSFSQRNKLTYHVRTHSGEKPYSCAECGRSFSLLWNLKTHLRTHTGEKPYACDTCGRRFTQKQNMTSHLTTHRKPKSDKSFRAQFQSELDEYDSNASDIMSADYSTSSVKPKNNFRALDQAKQLSTQTIGSNHYVLGDMQSIEVHTADDQTVDHSVNLEHGLGLLSSVARKGDSTDVQVDGIVNIPENQLSNTGGNLDQVVEVLIRSNVENESGNSMNQFQFANSGQSKIILDPHTQAITDGDGQEITMDTNTAAGLANILQNPDVLAAINSAASTNKFIVIGPVNMFDGSVSNAQLTSANSMSTDASSSFSQEQLAQISSIVAAEQDIDESQVSSQTVNDSISASTALAAVENYLQNDEQPSSSLSKDEVVTNILGSIQPDGKRGPSAVLQSANSTMPRSANLTIAMPPMPQSTLIISPSTLSLNVDSTHGGEVRKTIFPSSLKPLVLSNNGGASSSEVSSSVDQVSTRLRFDESRHSSNIDGHMEAESTTEPDDFGLVTHTSESIEQSYVQSTSPGGLADSSDMVVTESDGNEASSSVVEQEPILMLINDENGQPQIIVKMPDGTETIMSDPALAESLIQVPTITNADIDCSGELNEAEPSQSMVINQMDGTIQLQLSDQDQLPDQGIPQSSLLPQQSDHLQAAQLTNESDLQPSQSGLHSQNFSPNSQSVSFQLDNEAEASQQSFNELHHQQQQQQQQQQHQLPDQSSVAQQQQQHNAVDSTFTSQNENADSAYSEIASTYVTHEGVVDSASFPQGDVDSAYHCDDAAEYPDNSTATYSVDETVDSQLDNVVNSADSIHQSDGGETIGSVADADSIYSAGSVVGNDVVDSANVVLFTGSPDENVVDSVNDADSLYTSHHNTDAAAADSVFSGQADSANVADSVYVGHESSGSAYLHSNDAAADSSSNAVDNTIENNVISNMSIDSSSAVVLEHQVISNASIDSSSTVNISAGNNVISNIIDSSSAVILEHNNVVSSIDSSSGAVTDDTTDMSIDSSSAVVLENNVISNTTSFDSTVQTPDSSSQSSQRQMFNVGENQIDSRQALFVMEHVSASDQPEQSNDISTQNGGETTTTTSNRDDDSDESNFMADSSSGNDGNVEMSSTETTYYLQLSDVSQSSSHFQEAASCSSQSSSGGGEECSSEVQVDTEKVSSSEQ